MLRRLLAFFFDFEAYIICNSDPMITELLPMELNLGHGINASRDAALAQAKYAMDTFRLSKEVAGARYGLTGQQVGVYVNSQTARARALAMGYSFDEGYNGSILASLSGVLNDIGFESLCKLFTTYKLSLPESRSLIANMGKATTEQAMRELAAKEERRLKVTAPRLIGRKKGKRGGIKLPVQASLFRMIRGLENALVDKENANKAQLTDPEVVEVFISHVKGIIQQTARLFRINPEAILQNTATAGGGDYGESEEGPG